MPTLFVDTSIQVDRIIQEQDLVKQKAIKDLLAVYNFKATCTYSLVEYKRVVLQNLSLCLNYLIEEQSFFRALGRVASLGPQRSRRVSTLVSIMSWVGFKASAAQEVVAGGEIDELLTLQSMSFIRVNIFFLWKRFTKSVDAVLDRTQCARAREEPKKDRNDKVILQIRESLCKNRECDNANLLASKLPAVRRLCDELDKLEAQGTAISDELKKARAELRLAMKDLVRLYDYRNCLAVGDVWLHLESLAGGIKDFATTNYKESQHLCPALGLTMKKPY